MCIKAERGVQMRNLRGGGFFKYTQDKVVSNFQSSLRDWSCRDEYPALRAGLSSAVPSGLGPCVLMAGFFSAMAVQNRERVRTS